MVFILKTVPRILPHNKICSTIRVSCWCSLNMDALPAWGNNQQTIWLQLGPDLISPHQQCGAAAVIACWGKTSYSGYAASEGRHIVCIYTGIILCMRPANERPRYIVTSSLIGLVHSQNYPCTGIILCMCPANERRCYIVTLSLIGWAHSQNDPCIHFIYSIVMTKCKRDI